MVTKINIIKSFIKDILIVNVSQAPFPFFGMVELFMNLRIHTIIAPLNQHIQAPETCQFLSFNFSFFYCSYWGLVLAHFEVPMCRRYELILYLLTMLEYAQRF